jgi:hypothetical protein
LESIVENRAGLFPFIAVLFLIASHDNKIAQWALDAGVQSSDIEQGGRYATLMTMMLAENAGWNGERKYCGSV